MAIKVSLNLRGQFLITLASFVKKASFLLSFKSHSKAEVVDILLAGRENESEFF
jgi:hypothetical protein